MFGKYAKSDRLCWAMAMVLLSPVCDARAGEQVDLLTLALADPAGRCLSPDDTTIIMLSMSKLAQPVTGYQAFLSFDPEVLTLVEAHYTPAPFAIWIIYPIEASAEGHINMAAGIITSGTPSTEDAGLAVFTFMATTTEGSTTIGFRSHQPPTRFSGTTADPIWPVTVDSPTITVTSSTVDSDGDEVPDPCDRCPCFDDHIDTDGDGIPDGCDGFGDFDHDGDVDLADLDHFVECLNGPSEGELGVGCDVFDAGQNFVVDLLDFAVFQREFNRRTCLWFLKMPPVVTARSPVTLGILLDHRSTHRYP
ncbi:MAG: hypothetical protein KAV00_01060 [Phycisphaerae bacterium]|nr:hypothetical protein [Phycisphaerae bacterium]